MPPHAKACGFQEASRHKKNIPKHGIYAIKIKKTQEYNSK